MERFVSVWNWNAINATVDRLGTLGASDDDDGTSMSSVATVGETYVRQVRKYGIGEGGNFRLWGRVF